MAIAATNKTQDTRASVTLEIRAGLVTKRRHLLEQAKKEMVASTEGRDDIRDEGDQAAATHDSYLHAKLLEALQRQVKAIDNALRSMDDGTYGECDECGEEILIGRLRVMPFAVKCTECQESRETMSKIESASFKNPGWVEKTDDKWQAEG